MKFITAALSLACAMPVLAQETKSGLGDFSLEDLMQVEVTSVSKKPQRLAHVAAAVHVISAEDIRLSGAHSLPEALRLAPGIDATRISGNRWAVSIRGFEGRLANKLLVLVDGRNAYTPAFSGVLWEDFQFPLEDIERIEVLRGPAATVWGTNGVNGVINIITKSAAATQGVQVVAGAGQVEGAYGRVRMGGQNAEGSLFYRVYGSTQKASEQKALAGGDGQDSFRHQSSGFRIDGYRTDGSRWDVSGDFYSVRADIGSTLMLPGVAIANPGKESHHGAALRARYETPLANGGSLQFQGAYSHSNITIASVAADRRNTFDLDLQHRFKWGERHDIVWGGGYRITDDTMPRMLMAQIDDVSRRTVSYGFFGQDEITLADAWRLTLGLRMDHNEFTGWEAQPDARLSWNIAANHTLWGSLSKVARAPSRGEHGLSGNFIEGSTDVGFPFGSIPNLVHTYSPGDTSERMKAAQLGLRSQWAPSLSTDAVLFTHRYDRLNVYGTPTIGMDNFPMFIDVFVPVVSVGEMILNGAELSVDWRPAPKWRMQLSHTWQDVSHADTAVNEATTIPRNITSWRASWAPTAQIDVDVWLRHMGARSGNATTPYLARRAFDSVDVRLAWRPQKNLELALLGQNLNDGACDAYSGIVAAEALPKMLPTCMPRSLTAQMRLDF
jgi:iron complex outermembrane receptor protein